MERGITHDAALAHLFAPDLELRLDEADEAAARGVRLGMNVGMRWNRALIEMRRLAIDEGAIGTLAGGHLSLHFVRWPREWQTVEWCAGRAQGGPLREVGTHQLFALCELFGCGTRVRATVTYPDGATGTHAANLRVDAASSAPPPPMLWPVT